MTIERRLHGDLQNLLRLGGISGQHAAKSPGDTSGIVGESGAQLLCRLWPTHGDSLDPLQQLSVSMFVESGLRMRDIKSNFKGKQLFIVFHGFWGDAERV